MRFVIDNRQSSINQGSGFRFTTNYVEIEVPVTEQTAILVYVLPRNEQVAYVATCWGNLFDRLIVDQAPLDRLASRWPILATLVRNASSQRFTDGGMVHLRDPDDGQRRWCVAYVVDGINFSDADSVLGDNTIHAVGEVARKSNELLTELDSNEMNVWGVERTSVTTLDEIRRRLDELDNAEEYARYTLKKLDRPEGVMEYAWWGATWFSGTRRQWWSAATKVLSDIQEERIMLRAKEAALKRQRGGVSN